MLTEPTTGAMKAASQAEEAHRRIRNVIIRCELEPAERVSEQQLAERYGVGRAATRTALNRLSQERLVVVLPREGYLIAPITLKDVHDLYGARLLIEPPVARMVAGRLDAPVINRLRGLAGVDSVPGDPESVEAFYRASTELHVTIARVTGNDAITEIVANLYDRMERVLRLSHLLLGDGPGHLPEVHLELVDAIASGDGGRAERVMVAHVADSKRIVFEALTLSPAINSISVTSARSREE